MLTFVLVCLVVSAAGQKDQRRNTECLPEFGCFNSHGLVPVPQDPSQVNTHMKIFTRAHAHNPTVNFDLDHYSSQVGHFASLFDSSKDTKVVIHGYLNSGSDAWVVQMTDELLKKGDFNVIVVDWQGGSKQAYGHAVGNTYLVGAEVAKTLTYLHDNRSLDYSRVHIIGHSLGAQIAGHIGYRVKGIGRISALDPAEPDFRGQPTDQRLDQSDATFVDVIHTDGSVFIGVSGYGLKDPVGHVDFYPNGGQHQPGCAELPLVSAIGSILHGSVGGAAGTISCSHSRATQLFIESINSPCKFYAHTCSSSSQFDNGACMGCPSDGCPVMGYEADQTSHRGSFYLSTAGSTPYCAHEYYVEIHVSHFSGVSYGELFVTLVGDHGRSEEIKFSPRNEYFRSGMVEKHVIATNTDIGQVTSLRVRYDEPKPHIHHTTHTIKLHSIVVESTENSNQVKFCGHEYGIHSCKIYL
ncbi:inactive pancreatic lipase-related protein 1-like [Mizuhopecten yessoensis]|uniref:inactive pancreatic lipase-related protein 1-like n=1 Tax=Mizuhopecten yessoensis TaxID=6573 RepID=UPI000B45D9FD|nr:inactive pancreatic lipase-related protein 1-like [Mizuhopecten yessoensis]